MKNAIRRQPEIVANLFADLMLREIGEDTLGTPLNGPIPIGLDPDAGSAIYALQPSETDGDGAAPLNKIIVSSTARRLFVRPS